MNRLFYKTKLKKLSSKSLDIPDSNNSDSLERKTRTRDHFRRLRKSTKSKSQNLLVKSLPSSFSQSHDNQSPPRTQIYHKKFVSDGEDSSATSGSGLLNGTARSAEICIRNSPQSNPDHHHNHHSHNHYPTHHLYPQQQPLLSPFSNVNFSIGSSQMQNTNNGNIQQQATTSTNSQRPVLKRATASLLDPTSLVASHNFVTEDELQTILHQIHDQQTELAKTNEEIELLKNQYQTDLHLVHQSLQDERDRYERLEEQMNDMIELHQNEIANLKLLISDMEDKVQYQSEDRLRDINDALDNCNTKISKMEHQHNQQLQQLISLDALENSNARNLFIKLMNVVLTILQVVLLVVATAASIIIPFFKTRLRVLNTFFSLFFIFLLFQQKNTLLLFLQKHLDNRILYFINLISSNENT